MVDVARVNLFGRPMGAFRWDESRSVALFEYDADFASRGLEPSPLRMPVRVGRVYSFANLPWATFSGLPGLLADSLPDTYGRALFDRWLALTGRTSGNPVETLCFLGKRCMGALEYEPAVDAGYDPDMTFEIDALVDAAREALSKKKLLAVNLNDDRKRAITEIIRLGTSAGGQRAKAVIAYNKATGEIRSGQVDAPEGFDYYLLKLDGVSAKAEFRETENFGRLEYSFYRLAKERCGIEMMESDLIKENGRAHFLTKRFDRVAGKKVHMQTLCGLAHYDFRVHRAYSYEQALAVMRELRLTYAEAQEFFRRIVFNVAIRNQDDHTKNVSFLMGEDGRWRLSPAYDMGFAYNPAGEWTNTHQMSVNGKFDGIARADLLALASANNIKNAAEMIDQVCDGVSRWPEIARECEVPEVMIKAIIKALPSI